MEVTADEATQLADCRAALRELAGRLSRVEDDVRRGIAKSVHDDLGQLLAAVQLHLHELRRAGVSEAGEAAVDAVEQLVGDAIRAARGITFDLLSPVLPNVGLEVGLEGLAARLGERHGIPCRFASDRDPKPVTGETAVALFRVVRELLFNVANHSQADKAAVEVSRDGDEIRVVVSDDGVGISEPPRPSTSQGGFGLLIATERLRELGGSLVIEPVERGTRIVVAAPLDLEEAA